MGILLPFMSVTGRAKSLVTDKQHRLHLRGERDPCFIE